MRYREPPPPTKARLPYFPMDGCFYVVTKRPITPLHMAATDRLEIWLYRRHDRSNSGSHSRAQFGRTEGARRVSGVTSPDDGGLAGHDLCHAFDGYRDPVGNGGYSCH